MTSEGKREAEIRAADHLVPMGNRMAGEMQQIASEMGKEADADLRLDEGFERAIHEQPAAAADGLDLSPITSADGSFDPDAFRTLAREVFLKVREARGSQNRSEADGCLSETMETELNQTIDGDVASHRHHVLSQLDVTAATIVSAAVDGDRQQLGVRFVVGAEEIVSDERGAVVSDAPDTHWPELWQFERDPSVDASATDRQHALSFGADGWLFAHRGWVVTAIRRLNEPAT